MLLEGRLVVEGDGVVLPTKLQRALGSAKIAAVSRVLSPSRIRAPRGEPGVAERADRLALDCGLGRVVLQGPVTVLSGSRRISSFARAARTEGKRASPSYDSPDDVPRTDWFELVSVLADGDTIQALGLQRARRDGGAYRDRRDVVLSAAPSMVGVRMIASR